MRQTLIRKKTVNKTKIVYWTANGKKLTDRNLAQVKSGIDDNKWGGTRDDESGEYYEFMWMTKSKYEMAQSIIKLTEKLLNL